MKKIIAFVILFAFLCPAHTFALSCAQLPTVESAYDKYDGVILGHVDDIVKKSDQHQLRIKVIKSFKGVDVDQIVAKENMTWGESKKGEQFLYFLTKENSEWESPLCAPLKKAAEASEELKFLEAKGEIPVTKAHGQHRPASVSGTLAAVIVCSSGLIVYGIYRYVKQAYSKE